MKYKQNQPDSSRPESESESEITKKSFVLRSGKIWERKCDSTKRKKGEKVCSFFSPIERES